MTASSHRLSHWRTHSTETVTSSWTAWTFAWSAITTTCHLASKQIEAIDDVEHGVTVD